MESDGYRQLGSRDNLSRRHGEHDLAGNVRVAVEVVSAHYLNMLQNSMTWYGRTGRCDISRNQHNQGWYNVDDNGI